MSSEARAAASHVLPRNSCPADVADDRAFEVGVRRFAVTVVPNVAVGSHEQAAIVRGTMFITNQAAPTMNRVSLPDVHLAVPRDLCVLVSVVYQNGTHGSELFVVDISNRHRRLSLSIVARFWCRRLYGCVHHGWRHWLRDDAPAELLPRRHCQ